MPVNQAWLDLLHEEVIDPALPICDPHHHLWDHPQSRYLLEDLLLDTGSGHNVRETVFVECTSMYRKDASEAMKPVGETEFVQGIAAQSASGQYGETRVAAAITSFANLSLGAAVEPVLEAHRAASVNRFRGIRHNCGWDESPRIRKSHTDPPKDLYLDAQFRDGLACLGKHHIVFESFLYHTQLLQLADLARSYPDVSIILNHVGGPLGIGPYAGKRDEVFQIWSKGIDELAACPNIVVKLGGISMPINGFGWHKRETPPGSEELARVTAPYILYCIEKFGPARCMFESNFPVDKVSCSYTVLWNSFKRIVKDFSADEKADMFRNTALRAYSIEV